MHIFKVWFFILQHTEAICAFSNFCWRQTEWVLPEGAIWHSLFQTSQEPPTACYISTWCACAWVRPQCWAPRSSLSNYICSVCARACVCERELVTAAWDVFHCAVPCCESWWGFPLRTCKMILASDLRMLLCDCARVCEKGREKDR